MVHFTRLFTLLMPPGQQQANLWQAIDVFMGSSSECMGLISTNPCHKINHQLRYPKCIVLSEKCQEDVGEEAFDSMVTRAPCLPVLVLMGNDESTGGCEKAPLLCLLRTPRLWFPISTGVEVCSLAAGHSGSVLTKLCLFPGLQGSQGKLGSRGETNKKAPLSHTLKPLSNTFVFSTQRGYISLHRRAMAKGNKFFRNRASG